MELREGMKVEMRTDEKEYEGAWFEGTVKSITGSGRELFEIQYDKFVTDDGKPVVEMFPLQNIRPVPPQKELSLPLSQGLYVDAYDTDCWWRGFVVQKVLRRERWLVYFPDTETSNAYPLQLSAALMIGKEENGHWSPRRASQELGEYKAV